uniref:hypothetical protein n=1 Tax=Halomonas sp. TaxID=1486246 RepID=UPI00262346C6|nr:hypothetical protein [Halomonas sp.]
MRMTHLLLSAVIAITLAGCAYHPARIEPVPGIIIDDDVWYGHDHDDWEHRKEWEKDRKEWEKDRREWEKEQHKEWRERQKERRKWEKERRKKN